MSKPNMWIRYMAKVLFTKKWTWKSDQTGRRYHSLAQAMYDASPLTEDTTFTRLDDDYNGR